MENKVKNESRDEFEGLVTLVSALEWYLNHGYLKDLPNYLDLSITTIIREAKEDLKKLREMKK